LHASLFAVDQIAAGPRCYLLAERPVEKQDEDGLKKGDGDKDENRHEHAAPIAREQQVLLVDLTQQVEEALALHRHAF
jgi:hypothetical protein